MVSNDNGVFANTLPADIHYGLLVRHGRREFVHLAEDHAVAVGQLEVNAVFKQCLFTKGERRVETHIEIISLSCGYSATLTLASVYLYKTHYDGPAKLDEGTLRAVLGSLVAMWVVSLVSFALVIKRKYLHTF